MLSSCFHQKSVLIPKRTDFDFLHIDVTIVYARLDYIRFQLPGLGPFSERPEWIQLNEFLYSWSYTYNKTISISDLLVRTGNPELIKLEWNLRNLSSFRKKITLPG